ncbi:MlaD family protein [Amycolatopsis acidiphila]|uniref:MlaD family protein n=1 Tax=Amycolatopsis acidiphila TaxID=715473 RepID=UPI0016437097|nr:MlaD family protein [Amycolatopsis acidiphila]UIJ57716.1 MlaD family protein [Amycolatopsis acidiphila]
MLVTGVIVAALATTASLLLWGDGWADSYRVRVVMASAVGVQAGTPVQIGGVEAGKVDGVGVKDGKAVVTLDIDADRAPLPSGTRSSVEWRSVLGEHFVALTPGPANGPALPNGSLIDGGTEQVTVENLLESLDTPTRDHLRSLLPNLQTVLSGREQDLNATLKSAGPTVEALSSVMQAVGQDGPAIRELVTRLHELTSTLAGRQNDLSGVVRDLGTVTADTVSRQQQLADALRELPPTLDSARSTLDKVPAASDAVVPLLTDLAPATSQLPGVAANLSPLLHDLQPTVADLRPTLDAASRLLDVAPGLLDGLHATVPGVTQAVRSLAPAVAFLRPYTPEAMGFISNWGNVFSQLDARGHLANVLVTAGQTSLDNNPPVVTPGMSADTQSAPGTNVGQPWTDATGSQPR